MEKKYGVIYAAISILFIALLTVWFFIGSEKIRQNNVQSAESGFSVLSEEIRALYLTNTQANNQQFAESLDYLISSNPDIEGLFLHSSKGGFDFIFSRSNGILSLEKDEIENWRGKPEYQIDSFRQRLFSAPVSFYQGENGIVSIDAVYLTFSSEEFSGLLYKILLSLVIFFLISCIFCIVISIRKGTADDSEDDSTDFENENENKNDTSEFSVSADKIEPFSDSDEGPENEEMHEPEEQHIQGNGGNYLEPPENDSSICTGGHFSPSSGLVWNSLLDETLSFELQRAASFDQDLSLALIDCQPPANIDLFKKIADHIRELYNFSDFIFEYKETGIAVLLPQMDMDSAVSKIESIQEKLSDLTGGYVSFPGGISSRDGRLVSGELLIKEARSSLFKAKEEGDNSLYAFRPDPEKYRQYISGIK